MLNSLYARLVGTLILVLMVWGGYMYISNLKTEILDLNQKLASTQTLLTARITELETIKKDAQARLDAAQIELDAAKIETSKAQQRARIIYKKPPSTPGDACKSALDLVNGSGGER